ncbi:MAG: 30S ribosomal protein S18 [Candidatus Omnitrophica bacterium]|nr:30S ribosomal protein S18 [Candidatus Omnitrophota bacterium]MBU1906299.1 30S ribosomal protein S18 [Candidatus Omnitrophota bacterium]
MRGKLKLIRKKRLSPFGVRKKTCRFCTDKVKSLDYKEVKRLETFVNDRGKIVSSRLTGNCARHQRMLVETIKKARFISLLPYTR